MGTCYSTSNKLETTNSSTKRPYDKSFNQLNKSNSQNKTNSCHHQLITPSYLATITSNHQLITINNQIHELKPKNSNLNLNNSYSNRSTINQEQIKMYENKNKIISKLPKFTNRQQVHDLNQVKPSQIKHFGAKQILNADLLRLKNGKQTQQQSKSSNSSLTNSETSCGSSGQSTNSTASFTNVNNKLPNNRKLTFTKATSSSTLTADNQNQRQLSKQKTNSSKVISKQPTNTVKNNNVLSQHSSTDKLNTNKLTCSVAVQFSQALTKLPTSKFTTTVTSISIPKPQIAQRISSSSINTIRPIAFPNQQLNGIDRKSNNLYQNLDQKNSTLKSYSLKNTTLNENYQPYKKPYARAINNNQDVKLGSALRYPYSESNLKSKLTFNYHHNEDKSSSYYNSKLNNKKLSSYSALPVPNGFKVSSRDCLSHKSNSSKNNSNSSLNSSSKNNQSNDRLNQFNNHSNHFNQQNSYQSNDQNETSRSLTLERNESLISEKENKRLSTSYESSSLSKNLSERINHVKTHNKLFNQHNFNNLNKQNLNTSAQNTIINLQNLVNKKQQQLINNGSRTKQTSIENTDDSNSLNESQKSNSPNSSLTPDISSTSKISPEHNRSDFLIDDEICDQPDLMFSNSKDNSTTTSPIKEDINIVNNLKDNNENSNNYRTNIRYSITELDSDKLKQELLSQQPNYENDLNSVSSSPEKSSLISQSPVKFRKPRPLSIVESVDGNLALDGSSFRSVMQDINGIKKLLFRLQGELHKSETQNPFENVLNSSQCKNQNLTMSNGLDDSLDEDKCGLFMKEEDKNHNLELENQNLKKQLALIQQQMEEKDRTIRLLQQQMTKYLNINEANINEKVSKSTSTCNATTQTEFNKNFFTPDSKKTTDGFVVRSSDEII